MSTGAYSADLGVERGRVSRRLLKDSRDLLATGPDGRILGSEAALGYLLQNIDAVAPDEVDELQAFVREASTGNPSELAQRLLEKLESKRERTETAGDDDEVVDAQVFDLAAERERRRQEERADHISALIREQLDEIAEANRSKDERKKLELAQQLMRNAEGYKQELSVMDPAIARDATDKIDSLQDILELKYRIENM